MKIGFLGQGAMGSRMAARLVAAGHEVTRWNRTPQEGTAPTPEAAVAGADIVFASLRDNAASTEAWARALPAMAQGAVAVETSTIGPAVARALHAAAAARGIACLDAPVAGSRPQAEAGQLIFMAGGDAATLDRVDPVLRTMAGAVHLAGGPGSGAAVKLVVNALLASELAAMAELLGLSGRLGVDPARAVDILAATPVASPALVAAAGAMLAGRHSPAFPVDLVIKDLGLALDGGAELPVTAAVAAVFAQAAREGLGQENITAVSLRYLRR